MTERRFTLDTNVLAYYVDADSGPRHSTARHIVDRSFAADCILTLQALAEFYRVSTSKLHIDQVSARRQVEEWMASFTVVAADEPVLREAMAAVPSQGLAFWDAMLWATARAAGCRTIITEDYQSGRPVDGVLFVNPFGASALPPEIERVLAPLP